MFLKLYRKISGSFCLRSIAIATSRVDRYYEPSRSMAPLGLQNVIDRFEAQTKDAPRIQRQVLEEILGENGGTEYLRGLGLGGRTDLESFRACVPVATHGDLQPLIQRIADGDPSPILTSKPITELTLSSGTTGGKPKYVLYNEKLFDSTMHVYSTSFAYRNRDFPIAKGKHLSLAFGSRMSETSGGVTATTATMHILRGELARAATQEEEPLTDYCCPKEVIFGGDYNQSLYCHLLCGLLSATDIQFLSAVFIHTLVQALSVLENVWEELCSDIRHGVLSSRITVPSMREAVQALLRPDPELADAIHAKCKRLSSYGWYAVVPELWPNAKYVCGITTGSMEPYVKKLKNYAGNLPLVGSNYGSSEGWIGLNVKPSAGPDETTFVVVPDSAYFEFLPLAECGDGGLPEPIGIEDVKIGEKYEVLFTSYAGLYRYRLGDVVQVVGFYNASPELRFVCRRNLLLNINIDKNTEYDLQLAVEEAAKLLSSAKLGLIDFTSFADRESDPGHYIIFWELSQTSANDVALQACCDCLDQSFADAGYCSARKAKAIGPLELSVVKRGTFQKILEHSMGMGGAATQFKVPRCVPATNARLLEILNENVVGKYFSRTY